MVEKTALKKQPVAVSFSFQSYYQEAPIRQVEYEILCVKDGSGRIFFGNTVSEIQRGDCLFINSFEEHSFRKDPISPAFQCYRLIFDVSALGPSDDQCRSFFEGIKLARFLKISDEIIQRFNNIAQFKKDSEGYGLIIKSLLLDIISYAIETEQYEHFSLLAGCEKRSLSAIDNALHFIRENYSENINLGTILELTNYSKSHFIKLFKESTGMVVSEYINKYRIEKACFDLIYTNNNITEIAMACGFNNIQYFSRKFREYMKCTPKQYQKKKEKLIWRK